MNEKLYALYDSCFDRFCSAIQSIHDRELHDYTQAPILLTTGNTGEYENADIRVIIYGHDPNMWGKPFDTNLENLLKEYDEYFNQRKGWSENSPLWQCMDSFITKLKAKYPDKKVSFLWNDLYKVGSQDTSLWNSVSIQSREEMYFTVLREELQILKPTIVLFLSGVNSIERQIRRFGADHVSKLIDNNLRYELHSMIVPSVPFVFYTHPPGYLYSRDLNQYFQPIIDNIDLDDPDNIYLMTDDELMAEAEKLSAQKSVPFSIDRHHELDNLRQRIKYVQQEMDLRGLYETITRVFFKTPKSEG